MTTKFTMLDGVSAHTPIEAIDRLSEWYFFIDHDFYPASARLLLVLARHSDGAWDTGEVLLDENGEISLVTGFQSIIYNGEFSKDECHDTESLECLLGHLKSWIPNTSAQERVRH